MPNLPLLVALVIGSLLALLLIADWRMTGYLRRLFQAQPSQPPRLIDLAAEAPDGADDAGPTWLLLTTKTPAWTADEVAQVCARVWNVPVNEHEQDTNFVIGEAPCLMLRNGDWHYLLTIGDEPYMDAEQIPEKTEPALQQLFSAHHSWVSLNVVGIPVTEPLPSRDALRRSAQLLAGLIGEIGLILLGAQLPTPLRWTPELAAELRDGDVSRIVS